jgi:hypothetical protein
MPKGFLCNLFEKFGGADLHRRGPSFKAELGRILEGGGPSMDFTHFYASLGGGDSPNFSNVE